VIIASFRHRHAGHCESGVTSTLLTHFGMPISEPMALGLSSSLTFAHLPFVKVGGFPITAYRMLPGNVYKGLRKPLGLRMHLQRFRDADEAMRVLDGHLAAGRPVGIQASVFWLPYFPPEMRFHFNAHNLVVYGRDGNDYLVSDPVFDLPQRCAAEALRKSRFTQGAFAPRGLLYYPVGFDPGFALQPAVRRAVRKTVNMMLRAPLPIVGIRAMRGLAKRLRALPRQRPDPRYQRLFLGNIVRMQEEIGTGGGGFRFMYAAFLQEAGETLAQEQLLDASRQMTSVGDLWRQFALEAAQFTRDKPGASLAGASDRLLEAAAAEEAVYRGLAAY